MWVRESCCSGVWGGGGFLFLLFFCNVMVIVYNILCVHVLILYVCALIDLCVMALMVRVCVCECVELGGGYVWTCVGMHVVYITVYIFLAVWWHGNCKSVNDRFSECGLSEPTVLYFNVPLTLFLVVIANSNIFSVILAAEVEAG